MTTKLIYSEQPPTTFWADLTKFVIQSETATFLRSFAH